MELLEHTPVIVFLLLGVGLVGGLFGGMLGLGGGWLFGPTLSILGLPAVTVVGTSLLAMVAQSSVSAWKYHRKKLLRVRLGLTFGGPALLGMESGRQILQALSAMGIADTFLRAAYAVTLVLIGTSMLRPVRMAARSAGGAPPSPHWAGALVVGFLVGNLSGILGIGGGVVLVPLLTRAFGFPMTVAVATSLLSILISSSYGAAINLWTGRVDVWASLVLAAGAIAGGYLGSSLAMKADERLLKRLFAGLAFAVATSVLLRIAGFATLSQVTLFGGALTLGVVAVLSVVLRPSR